MSNKTFTIATLSILLIGCAGINVGIAAEGKKGPAAAALKNVGPTLAKAYTF